MACQRFKACFTRHAGEAEQRSGEFAEGSGGVKMRKFLGLIPTALALTQHWWWEFARAFIYEKIIHQVEGSFRWEWLVQYGFLALLTGLALWLFWPELEERLLGSKMMLVDEAARIAYEAAEKAGGLDLVSMTGDKADEKLSYFRYAFLLWPEFTVFGAEPPSQAMKPIPRNIYNQLRPIDGHANSLGLAREREPRYVNVSVKRGDLRRGIKKHMPGIAEESARLRKG